MSATATLQGVIDRFGTPENASICTGILVAVPALVTLALLTNWDELPILATMLLGVIVPSSYQIANRPSRSVGGAIRWTLVACVLAGTAFLGLAYGLREAGVGPTTAAVGAFLLPALGVTVVQGRRSRSA